MPRSLDFPSLKVAQLGGLQRVLRSRTTPAGLRQRSELIWLLAGGASLAVASEWVGLHYTNAHIWSKRFLKSGLAGLSDRPRRRPPARLRKRRRYRSDQSRRRPAQGPRTSLHNLVAAQIAGVPEQAIRPGRDHALDYPATASSGRISFL